MAKRLDQLLSNLGYGSRSEVKRLISSGAVTKAGQPLRDPAVRIEPEGICVDGEELEHPGPILVMFHKPAGYVCSRAEDEGATIYEVVPEQWSARNPQVTSIGRLDKDTTGLILLTDELPLIHKFTSPKSKVEKTYEVTVDEIIPRELPAVFAEGSLLLHGESAPCLPAKLEIVSDNLARVTLTEGRYHQVKRMFAACQLTVQKLHRTRFGRLELGSLPCGEWVSVAAEDI